MESTMDIDLEVGTNNWQKERGVIEGSGEREVSPMMIMKIRELTFKIFKLGIQSVERAKFVLASLTSIIEKLESIGIEESGSVRKDDVGASFSFTEQLHIRIGDSEHSITKSKPNNSQRIHSDMVEGQNWAKKRTCSHCKKKGHYMSTCPEKKMMGEGQKPAKKRTCSHCKNKGHYMSTCPEKKMMGEEVTVEDRAVLPQLPQIMGGTLLSSVPPSLLQS